MRRVVLAMLAMMVAVGASVSTQQRVITRMEPFDYDVVPNWSLPYPTAGFTCGSAPGIFVESDDRIFIVSRGEIPIPSPVPAGFQGFFGSLRSALGAPENEVRGCIRVVDSDVRLTVARRLLPSVDFRGDHSRSAEAFLLRTT